MTPYASNRTGRLSAAVAGILAFATLFSGCSAAPAQPAATPAPTDEAVTVTMAPTPTPTATPEPTPSPTPEPKNRSQTSGKVIPEGTPSKVFIMSIDNADGAKPQTALMDADIVYEFLVEQTITRFQAVFNDTYPLYAGPLRSTRYYFIDLAHEWDCMYLHEGYVVLDAPYKRFPSNLISLYLPSGDFAGYSATFSRKKGAYDDFETKNGYKFRAPETGRGDVHALYYRVAALVNRYFKDYESKVCQRFNFLENVSYADGKPFTNVALPFDNNTDPKWIQFSYHADDNRIYRSEAGQPTMTRVLKENGDSYDTVQMNVQNLIVQYVNYGSVKGDTKHRRTCDLVGEGKCDYFINGQHVTGTWSRPTADDYTSYFLDDGTLVTLEPGNTWIAVHPADIPATIE
ncbi:MAG: DUF3048 domain-containing protein [Christensenella sp.]|nr:DUF3048 domain-containing protein [Christensenella sp.]